MLRKKKVPTVTVGVDEPLGLLLGSRGDEPLEDSAVSCLINSTVKRYLSFVATNLPALSRRAWLMLLETYRHQPMFCGVFIPDVAEHFGVDYSATRDGLRLDGVPDQSIDQAALIELFAMTEAQCLAAAEIVERWLSYDTGPPPLDHILAAVRFGATAGP